MKTRIQYMQASLTLHYMKISSISVPSIIAHIWKCFISYNTWSSSSRSLGSTTASAQCSQTSPVWQVAPFCASLKLWVFKSHPLGRCKVRQTRRICTGEGVDQYDIIPHCANWWQGTSSYQVSSKHSSHTSYMGNS